MGRTRVAFFLRFGHGGTLRQVGALNDLSEPGGVQPWQLLVFAAVAFGGGRSNRGLVSGPRSAWPLLRWGHFRRWPSFPGPGQRSQSRRSLQRRGRVSSRIRSRRGRGSHPEPDSAASRSLGDPHAQARLLVHRSRRRRRHDSAGRWHLVGRSRRREAADQRGELSTGDVVRAFDPARERHASPTLRYSSR